MLSSKVKYAIIASLHLARQGEGSVRLIADIASEERIPKKFLELILLELKNAGILGSKKGKGGGYHLAKPAQEVTLGSIMRIIDGPIAPVRCVSQSAPELCTECVEPKNCAIQFVMRQVRDALSEILDRVTLAQLVEIQRELRLKSPEAVMYYI